MIDVIDTICKDSIFNFSEIEKKDIDKSLSTLSSNTIKKICDTYDRKDDKGNNLEFWDFELLEYLTMNKLFKEHNIKTVKWLGGGSNIAFFLAQLDNQIESCVTIDINWNPNNTLITDNINNEKYKQYIDEFNYTGEYTFKNIKVEDDEDDFEYDCVVNETPQFNPKYLPRLYFFLHNRDKPWLDKLPQIKKFYDKEIVMHRLAMYHD